MNQAQYFSCLRWTAEADSEQFLGVSGCFCDCRFSLIRVLCPAVCSNLGRYGLSKRYCSNIETSRFIYRHLNWLVASLSHVPIRKVSLIGRLSGIGGDQWNQENMPVLLSFPWTDAIVNAVSDPKYDVDTVPSCPSGNCTWPVFSSLGFCSNCRNITPYVNNHTACHGGSRPIPINAQGTWLEKAYADTVCNYGLPNSSFGRVLITDSAVSNSRQDEAGPGEGGYYENFTITYYSNEWGGGAPYFSIFAVNDGLTTSPFPDWFNGTSQYQTPFQLDDGTSVPSKISHLAFLKTIASSGLVADAHLCALSFCARQYNVSVKSGTVSTSVISTTYSNMTYNISVPQTSYAFATGDHTLAFTAPARHDSTWTTESWLNVQLGDILQGNLTLEGVPIGDVVRPNATDHILYNFNASTDIPATMDRVALAMTTHLRELSNLTQSGQSGSLETVIRVKWAWLCLPAALVVSGAICLLVAIRETKKHGSHVWKSSAMALLFHGVDTKIQGAAYMEKMSEMDALAKQSLVQLAQCGEDGMLLRQKLD